MEFVWSVNSNSKPVTFKSCFAHFWLVPASATKSFVVDLLFRTSRTCTSAGGVRVPADADEQGCVVDGAGLEVALVRGCFRPFVAGSGWRDGVFFCRLGRGHLGGVHVHRQVSGLWRATSPTAETLIFFVFCNVKRISAGSSPFAGALAESTAVDWRGRSCWRRG